MRIRQVKPAFWSDATVAELSERTRLFYIGLWMIADDAGWLRWNAVEVARDLYGYEPRTKREKRVEAMFGELVDAKRVVLHGCGHAVIPTMPGHQRLAGATKQVQTVFNEHLREVSASRTSPQVPDIPRHGKERLGTDVEQERNGQERSGQTRERDETETEFRRRVGLPAVMGGVK